MINAITHLLRLLRSHLSRRASLALQKRRLETLLRQRGIPRSTARDICWHFFND